MADMRHVEQTTIGLQLRQEHLAVLRPQVRRRHRIAPIGPPDHLLAEPIYAPDRCSIGFHPLHTAPAVAVYAGLLLPRRTRLFGIGLLLHIVLDAIDCVWMRCTG